MGKFANVLIVTDLDGTLLDSQKKIGVASREAIRYFISDICDWSTVSILSRHSEKGNLQRAHCLCQRRADYQYGRREHSLPDASGKRYDSDL